MTQGGLNMLTKLGQIYQVHLRFFITFIIVFNSPYVWSMTATPSANLSTSINLNTPDTQCLEKKGILITAHGKSGHSHGDHHSILNSPINSTSFLDSDEPKDEPSEPDWDKTILSMIGEAASQIPYPLEVALGMWDQESLQEATTQLASQGVCDLFVIPLFISDHSDVIRAQKYQFHITDENPLPFEPGRVEIPSSIQRIRYGTTLNDHEFLSQIIEKRALKMSKNQKNEMLILVAHGPNSDEDDLLWLRDLSVHASRLKTDFAQIHTLTLRDDAPPPIRDQKTKELRNLVQEAHNKGLEPLILPVLLAPGGIEAGIHERLNELSYRFSTLMLAPDPLLIDWIIQQSQIQ